MIVFYFLCTQLYNSISICCHARFIVLAIIELSVAGSERSRTALSLSKGRTRERCVILFSVSPHPQPFS